MTNSTIGLIGLGVMGQNLALNIERNGYPTAVFDREAPVVQKFLSATQGKRITGARSPKEFVRSLERPRKIVLLVKGGEPVDWTINLIKPHLNKQDIIIDSGNSYFRDTERRQQQLQVGGLYLIGSGTSGGEKGASLGPSLMPGGDPHAYEQIRTVWEAIAAQVEDGPCVTYIGPGGAGHFVKMVHNGIEYGDMQLIAEAYDILRSVLRLSASEIGDIFAEWNSGELESYLIEITEKILRVADRETGAPLVDFILDKAGQKGTGKWTSREALDLGVPIPTIDAAMVARNISALKDVRVKAAKEINGPVAVTFNGDKKALIDAVHHALYASKICSYAQGMHLMQAGSDQWGWKLDLSEIARIWQGGCIIRARILRSIKQAYKQSPNLPNLLLDPHFKMRVEQAQFKWRTLLATAFQHGVPVPAMTASLSYFDLFRAAKLPLNLTQAQRDFFGSHMYERVDRPELGLIHTDWENLPR